jgi:hypothetical protein
VDPQDPYPALQVGSPDDDLAVEAAGPKQRRVEDVGPVGRRNDDDTGFAVEPVHLDKELVEGLLALIVATAEADAPVPTDGVDLVDEHDGRSRFLGLGEQVANPAGPDPDEHLDEGGPGDGEERHAGLTGDGAGEEGLARPRRTGEEHSLGDLGPHRGVLVGRFEEVLDLGKLLHGLIETGDVIERDVRLIGGEPLGLGPPHPQQAAAGGFHAGDEEDGDPDEQKNGEEGQDDGEGRRFTALHRRARRRPQEQRGQLTLESVGIRGLEGHRFAAGFGGQRTDDDIGVHPDFCAQQAILGYQSLQFVEGHVARRVVGVVTTEEDTAQDHGGHGDRDDGQEKASLWCDVHGDGGVG